MTTNILEKADRFTRLTSWLRQIGVDSTMKRFLAPLVHVCFFGDAKLRWLLPASFLMWAVSVWLMLSPGVIYSKELTWDLLFNLEGAWRLYTGQVPHLDFHTPSGILTFAITSLGFQLVGVKPIAFVVGECVLAAAFTVLAILAVKDRLPALAGFLFVSICVALVLVPVTVGDQPTAFTFGMSYNRFGWSALSILSLLLFIEPCPGRDPIWTDLAAGIILTLGLFYLKITYFGVAMTAISLALLTSHHIRRHWPWWCGTLSLALLVTFAPINDGYRGDIFFAIASGRVHSNPLDIVLVFARTLVEQAIVFGEIIVLLYLVGQRCATLGDVFCGLFIWISGLFLLSQNAQTAAIPLYTVLTLLVYVRLGDWLGRATQRQLMLVSCLMTCALLPLSPLLVSTSLTLIGYNIRARQSSSAFVVTTTNLKGLVVPANHGDMFDELAARQDVHGWRKGFEPSESEYIKTILALADFLADEGAASARIIVIDQVNPLPFVLGASAPRGGNLWSGGGIAWQPPEQALGEADYVAIPRFPTQKDTLVEGLKTYQDYLSARFVQRYETPYWTVLQRRNAL